MRKSDEIARVGVDQGFFTEEQEHQYALALRDDFGDIPARFPPASVVELDGVEYAVVGYFEHGDDPSLMIVDLAEMPAYVNSDRGEIIKLCPTLLDKIKLLYNQNGADFAAKFSV